MKGMIFAAAMVVATAAAASEAPKKQLRWYVGNPDRIAGYLLGSNPDHLLNSSTVVSDITGGIYQCCNSIKIAKDGTLGPPGTKPPWNATAFRALDMYMTFAMEQNCSASGTPQGCWSVGQTCRAALARGDAFRQEVLAIAEAYDLKGIMLDIEYGYGNDIACHEQLWGAVSAMLHKSDRELSLSVGDSQGNPFDKNLGNWSPS